MKLQSQLTRLQARNIKNAFRTKKTGEKNNLVKYKNIHGKEIVNIVW